MTSTGKGSKKKRVRRNVKVPLSWRALAMVAMVPVGLAIFYFGVHRAGVTLPISEKDRDSIFFSFIFAVAIPAFIYSIIRVLMVNMLLKKSSAEIGKEIAKDVAVAVAVSAVDAVIGSSGGSSSDGSSSEGTKGGGGDFGGGGASGGY